MKLNSLFALLLLLLPVTQVPAMGIDQIQYMTREEFVEQAFAGSAQAPEWTFLRLTRDLKASAAAILGHPYQGMRVRYWQAGARSAWIIDEIGKDMPITIGVVVDAAQIHQVSILVYREERGGEVHQDFFTRQFQGLKLQQQGLSGSIDGITGATLSVAAVTRAATLALMLDAGRSAQ